MAQHRFTANNGPSPQTLQDCRVYERKDCSLPTTCQPAAATDSHEVRWNATIQNISQGGVCLHLPRRFEKGTSLAIELPGDMERESAIVFVKVVHLRHGNTGGWMLGCKFVSELSEDEIERLLSARHHILSSKKSVHADDTV